MKAAITELEIVLETMETNEPINRANGNAEQADLEAENAADFRQALAVLKAASTVEEALINAGDAMRYRWLVRYLVGSRTDLDDAIVAAKTKEEHDAILDADMMATTRIPNER